MRMQIPLTALGLALVAGAPAANAQTVIARGITDQPVETVVTQRPSGTLVSEEPLVPVPSGTLVTTQPVETVKTVETVRTVRPLPRAAAQPIAHRQVVHRQVVHREVVTTRQTVVRQRVVPTQAVVARSVQYSQPVVTAPPAPAPLYDTAAPAPIADAYPPRPPYDDAYPPRPLYDEVLTAPVPAAPIAEETIVDTPITPASAIAPSSSSVGFYRYVYEPHRILVIDPTTNIAVQAIPR